MSTLRFYVLDANDSPVLYSGDEWTTAYEELGDRRKLKVDHVTSTVHVSTIFLGYGIGEDPLLYETRAFGPGYGVDEYSYRTTSKEAALKAHAAKVVKVRRREGLEKIDEFRNLRSRKAVWAF